MASSYQHRFARTFHQISREHPELPLGQRFAMASLQIREARLTALITELESYRASATGVRSAEASTPSPQVAVSATHDLPVRQPFAGQIPGQWAPQPAMELPKQPGLELYAGGIGRAGEHA